MQRDPARYIPDEQFYNHMKSLILSDMLNNEKLTDLVQASQSIKEIEKMDTSIKLTSDFHTDCVGGRAFMVIGLIMEVRATGKPPIKKEKLEGA